MRSLPVRTILVRSHTCPTSRACSPTPSSRTSPSSRAPSLPCPSSRVPSRTRPSSPYRVSACTHSTPRVRLWLPTYTSRVRYSRMRGGADVDVGPSLSLPFPVSSPSLSAVTSPSHSTIAPSSHLTITPSHPAISSPLPPHRRLSLLPTVASPSSAPLPLPPPRPSPLPPRAVASASFRAVATASSAPSPPPPPRRSPLPPPRRRLSPSSRRRLSLLPVVALPSSPLVCARSASGGLVRKCRLVRNRGLVLHRNSAGVRGKQPAVSLAISHPLQFACGVFF
ncbi:unnamed protein product [Closterium sp. NIES-65]|nr:unnamed protein product [Closterium sp. NIES-65]